MVRKNDKNTTASREKPVISQLRPKTAMGRQEIVPGFTESVTSFVVEVAKVVIISLAIIIPVRYFLIQPFYVKGASMEPNFYDNQYLVIDELSYRFHEPNRGDVIVLRKPQLESDFLIKRVIATPGERIQIANGQVTIFNAEYPYGVVLDESAYLASTVRTTGSVDLKLGSNEYFVLGDNRDASLDSRYFGVVTRKEIVGRTWVRAWPLNVMKVFSTPSYSGTVVQQADL
jgi:signal peptidase I